MMKSPNNRRNQARRPDHQNVGNAGEYYFAARLSAEDFTATITLGRAETSDIVAVDPKGRTHKFSVKAAWAANAKGFPLSDKDQRVRPGLHYAFIRLNAFECEPDLWIVPSSVVGPVIGRAHKKYLRAGHKDNSIRKLPIHLSRSEQVYFPKNWEQEMAGYKVKQTVKELVS
jgi:hypothetical protein